MTTPAEIVNPFILPKDFVPADGGQGLKMLLALGRLGKHVYAVTVPAHVKARRRAADRVATDSRRFNRRR